MKTVAIIPARYASTRFPGKPLAQDTGKFLIQHVYEQVQVAPLVSEVLVATDDQRIFEAVRSFDGKVAMTRSDHPSGTDRLAEVTERLDCDVVVNVQGDEPEIEPVSVSQLIEVLQDHEDCPMATLACLFKNVPGGDPSDPNAVKVLVDDHGIAIDFSRKPFLRDTRYEIRATSHEPLLHLGIYAYRRDFLLKFSKLSQTPREKEERLEQLRAIEHGYKIAVGIVRHAAVGIDTPDDYAAFVQRWFLKSRRL